MVQFQTTYAPMPVFPCTTTWSSTDTLRAHRPRLVSELGSSVWSSRVMGGRGSREVWEVRDALR